MCRIDRFASWPDLPRARGHGDLQTADSESAPQEFHLRVDLTRPPSLVATDCGAWRRFNARLLTGRGVVYPQPVMAVPAVLPQYLLPGSRPLVLFENNRRIVFADGFIWLSKFSRRRRGRERFASHVVGFEKPFFRTIFRNFSNIFSIVAGVWKLRAETGQTARQSRSDFCIQ